MPEQVNLGTPVVKTRTGWTLDLIQFDLTTKTITIRLFDNLGEHLVVVYNATTTPTGAFLLNAVNTANLGTNSLVKRIFNQLITSGYLPTGTVSGTPE